MVEVVGSNHGANQCYFRNLLVKFQLRSTQINSFWFLHSIHVRNSILADFLLFKNIQGPIFEVIMFARSFICLLILQMPKFSIYINAQWFREKSHSLTYFLVQKHCISCIIWSDNIDMMQKSKQLYWYDTAYNYTALFSFCNIVKCKPKCNTFCYKLFFVDNCSAFTVQFFLRMCEVFTSSCFVSPSTSANWFRR